MKRVLVHMCCGPCSIYPLKSVLDEEGGFEVSGFFYNPNIAPMDEYHRRRAAVEKLSSLMALDVIFSDIDSASAFSRDSAGTPIRDLSDTERCNHCYTIRLHATASAARTHGFDFFTSSLFYSRYQNHDLMIEIAEEAARANNVKLLYRDFREGWREGIEKSKEMGLYRQKYCGCIFSWMERYKKGPYAGDAEVLT